MKIVDLKATTIALPLEAPLRHAAGAHWGRFVRTIVEVVTDEGLSGWGELGGGGETAENSVRSLLPYLKGHDPLQLEQLRWKIMNPVASLYNARMQVHAAIEMACMDVAGKALGIRACDLIGGALARVHPVRELPVLSLRQPGKRASPTSFPPMRSSGKPRRQKSLNGFKTHKLKGGVFKPDHDVEVFSALADAFPGDSFRLDPNSVWSVEEAIRVAGQIAHVRNDYFEDPCFGLEGMRRLRDRISIPTATNTVVVNFEQLGRLYPAGGGRRDPARHNLLGRTAPGLSSRAGARDLPVRHQCALVGRGRHPAGLDAASRGGASQHELCRRRPLPSSARRHHRRRQDEVCGWRDRPAQGSGPRGGGRSRQARTLRRPLPRCRGLCL